MAMALAFSDDLITEILLRLPVKSVVRFKSVSKKWLWIASSGVFRKMHASRSSRHATGLLLNTIRVYEFLPLVRRSQITPKFLATIGNREILSSSGGLLLLRPQAIQSAGGLGRYVHDYFVCNPTTNEIRKLGLVPQPIIDSVDVCAYLAFDPRKSPDYKILFLYLCLKPSLYEMVIYSSESERFSLPPRRLYLPSTLYICGGYCNDAMHWISDNSRFHYFDFGRELLMTKEGAVPPPDCFGNSSYFGETQGHVFQVVRIIGGGQSTKMCVFELKSDYSGWSEKYGVELLSMANAFPNGSHMWSCFRVGRFMVVSVILINKQDEEESLRLVIRVDGGYYVTYNFNNNRFVLIGDKPRMIHRNFDRLYSWQYIETLACV